MINNIDNDQLRRFARGEEVPEDEQETLDVIEHLAEELLAMRKFTEQVAKLSKAQLNILDEFPGVPKSSTSGPVWGTLSWAKENIKDD